MSFLSAAFLFGLTALAVPIVLHLIHRQRYPERKFPSLRFFELTIKHNVLQRRLIDKILLALRLLALAALAFGLARPFWHGPFGQPRLSLVLVLDNSPSMGRSDAGHTLFEKARQAAEQVASRLGPDARAELILTAPATGLDYTTNRAEVMRALNLRTDRPTGLLVEGAAGRALSVPGLTTNLAALQSALAHVPPGTPMALCGDGLATEPALSHGRERLAGKVAAARLSSGSGDLRGALQSAARLLRHTSDGDRTIMVFSDLQQSEWDGVPPADLHGLSVRVVRVATPARQGPNLAVEGCKTLAPEAGLGQSIVGMATIRNYGTEPSRESKLAVTAGPRGKPVDIKVPPIPAGTATRVAFPLTVMARERNLLCTVVLDSPEDPLPSDNTWHFQLGVRPPVSVLCVNGTPDAVPAGRESYFVMNALGLPGAAGRAEARVDITECDVDGLEKQPLFQYRVVILAGVDRLSEVLRGKLKEFAAGGGGLLVFPGREANPDEYNGWGFLPARVTEKKADVFTFVKSLSENAPAVATVADRMGSGIAALTARTWLNLAPAPGAETLAVLAGDEPALVQGKLGRGQVVLSAVGCHTADSDWPLRPAFPVLLHELVRSLGAPAVALPLVPDRTVGEGAARAISAEFSGGTPAVFRLARREGQEAYDALPWLRNGQALVLPAADQPGHYLLSVRPVATAGLLDEPGVGASIAPVCVNHGASESDLAALKADQVPGKFAGAAVREFALADDVAPLVADLHTGRDLWRILLLLALVFLVLESLVGWRVPSQSMG